MSSLAQNRVLIVIVTYNRADATCVMLESLFEVKTSVAFDLIVIDNLSKKEEHDAIKAKFDSLISKNQATGIFISNTENTGYSAANNLGLKHAYEHKGRYSHVCLLNNDTIVSDYWMDRLIAHQSDGLIGPVSNSVGNEQKVPAFYDINVDHETLKKSAYQYANEWHRVHEGNLVKTWMLGFFCVFGPVQVFEKIGLLDEKFGIGTYEDDDYCHRARELKIPLYIARDVYIHHWGSASFSKLNQMFFFGLMERNRNYYETKNSTKWKHPVTTTFEAYRNELLWAQNHSDPLIDRSLAHCEAFVKQQIGDGNIFQNLFRTGPLWMVIENWALSNFTQSKKKRVLGLRISFLLAWFDEPKKLKEKYLHSKQLIQRVLHEA